MTDESTTARKMAIDCEMLKVAYRQSKDGIVVSFLIHPQHVPDGLAVAALGTRYIVALVEIGDDETPRPPKQKEVDAKPRPDSFCPSQGGARRSFHEMTLAEQAGMLSADPAFIKFLETERCGSVTDSTSAAVYVRALCGIKSRSELKAGGEPAQRWTNLVSDYRAWMREPEVV